MSLLRISDQDNVAVVLHDVQQGQTLQIGNLSVTARDDIPMGHKIAVVPIEQGANVVKYGFPIGQATVAIAPGDWVHSHSLETNLGDLLEYQYQRAGQAPSVQLTGKTFQGYRRENGKVGTRNEIWLIPTVSCVNRSIQLIAKLANEQFAPADIDGIYEFTHPYGCSQLGQDQLTTQKLLADLVNHPNAGGVLVVSLGCENNNIVEFKRVLGAYDPERVKFLVAQEVGDELAAGVGLVRELVKNAAKYQRTECPAAELVVGLKCGGSDAFSGITANPLVGAFSDKLIAHGGSTVLTEVPEMFGAETILMNRAASQAVFDKTVKLINDFKQYFQSYHQPVYENPSPGNKQGGITTLEEKSLGCTQKGGTSDVVDVLQYGDVVRAPGLNLLNGPGNDMVAATALAAAGCQLILFTTGRGTPLGTAVPTIKIATNSGLFKRKANWLDFNAGQLLTGVSRQQLTDEFFDYVLAVGSGTITKAEKMGFREIAIFKNGVTL